jgi:hypothetical protein
MAVYTPPTETLPIFDSTVFPASINSALTPSTGQSYFLSYPVAQGQETISTLQTTNVIANPVTTGSINIGTGQTTGSINIGTGQTSGILQLGSTTRTGIIYLGNVIIEQLSGILSYSLNSFTGLTTLNLFSGASTGFSSGFTTTNFLQGTLFKDMVVNMLTVGSLSSGVSMAQDIVIGSGTCNGTGSNASTLVIGNYRSAITGTNTATITIGSSGEGYDYSTTTNLRGKLISTARDSISGTNVTRNIYGYVDYILITSTPYVISDVGNNINLFVNIGGSGSGGYVVTFPIPSLMNGQYITFRSTRLGDAQCKITTGNLIVPLGSVQGSAVNSIQCLNTQCIQLYSNGTYWYQIN